MAKAHAVRFHKTGGPEVLQWEEVDVPAPGAGSAARMRSWTRATWLWKLILDSLARNQPS